LPGLNHVELDALSFVEGAVAAALDVRVVDKHIVALLTSDEAEALLGIEEFYGAYSQLILFSERGTTRAVVSGLVTLPDPPASPAHRPSLSPSPQSTSSDAGCVEDGEPAIPPCFGAAGGG